MPKASDLTASNLSFLFKGSPGSFKTLAAVSFASAGPVLLNYFDKSKPIELTHFITNVLKRPELLKNIEYKVFSAPNAHEYLNDLMALTKRCDYFAVVTDSVTSMTASAVNWSLGFRNPAGAKKDPLNPKATLMIPDFDEYKVETSYITQALDISRTLPCHIIWTAHPLSKMVISGGTSGSVGDRMKITKSNSIVSYGSKVADLIPGQFTEIYHFSKLSEWDQKVGKSIIKGNVSTRAVGDEYAKTALNLPEDFDITDQSFYEVWSSLLKG